MMLVGRMLPALTQWEEELSGVWSVGYFEWEVAKPFEPSHNAVPAVAAAATVATSKSS